jgi:hypothetical protein
MQTQNNQPPAPTVVPTDKARHGVTGHNVRYVSLSALSAWRDFLPRMNSSARCAEPSIERARITWHSKSKSLAQKSNFITAAHVQPKSISAVAKSTK